MNKAKEVWRKAFDASFAELRILDLKGRATRLLSSAPPEPDKLAGLREALNGDACLALDAGNLEALAWHLEQGKDNGAIERPALALFLRAVACKLKTALAALEAPR